MQGYLLQPDRVLNELHIDRIKRELSAAGLGRYGRMKFASHYVARIVHQYEHIKGVVYGRYGTSAGFFSKMNEGMLIATDRRVFFLDHKPGYTDLKEFTYDIVSGIEQLTAGASSAMTLYTRIGDYTICFANPRCVKRFMDYVELRRLESENPNPLPQEKFP